MSRRQARTTLAVLLCLLVPGCSCGDASPKRTAAPARTPPATEPNEFLELAPIVPPASLKTRPPSSDDMRTQWQMKAYLDEALTSVTGYWAVTAQHNGLTAPAVKHVWVRRGRSVKTACGLRANDQDAFYCPGDTTIYVGLAFGLDLWHGLALLPGGVARSRRARGDAGVAFVVAHEAAHAVSEQYRLRGRGPQRNTKAYELGADCAAGMWANSMYRRGAISSLDIQQAANTAAAVGDYDRGSGTHHGTPAERRAAWRRGYAKGDIRSCQRYFLPSGSEVGTGH